MARVGADHSAEGREPGVQDVENDSWLDDDPVRTDRNDSPEMAAEINDETRAESLASQAGSCPSGVERDRVLGGIADEGCDVLTRPRDDDTEGVNLVKTRVVRVRGPLDRLEEKFAAEDTSQIVVNPGPELVHVVSSHG
jgi:hypothetical protein